MTAPTDLIERLEGASVGSRELDAAVWCALCPGGATYNASRKRVTYFDKSWATIRDFEPSTTSLDAALALAARVLPGWEFGTYINRPDINERRFTKIDAHRWQDVGPENAFACTSSQAATPALALCIAILRASEQSK